MKKQFIKTKLASLALAGLSLLPTTKATTIKLDIEHPFATFNSRANINYSANQLTRAGLEKIDDGNILTRGAKTAAETYAASLFSYITHEAGHDETETEFTCELRPGTLTPKTKTQNIQFGSSEEESDYYARGLNQNTFNAEKTLESAILNNETPGISHLWNTTALARYSPIETRSEGETINDIDGYVNALSQRGIKTSRKKIQKGALIANALTLQNWATGYNTINHIATGKKSNSLLTFKVADTEFTPPAISCYLGKTGIFYNATSFINPKSESPLAISAGKENGVTRVGVKKYNIQTPIKNLEASPSIYLGSDGGYSIGTDLAYKLSKKSSLRLTLEQSEGDLMSRIKDTKGFNAVLGIRHKF